MTVVIIFTDFFVIFSPSSSLSFPFFDFLSFIELFALRVASYSCSHDIALLPLTGRFNFLSFSFISSTHNSSIFNSLSVMTSLIIVLAKSTQSHNFTRENISNRLFKFDLQQLIPDDPPNCREYRKRNNSLRLV